MFQYLIFNKVSFFVLCHFLNTVSVLGGEEGYTVKYGLNPREFPSGAARGNFRGLRPYFAVYPESSPNTDIISFLKVTLWPFSVLPSEVGLYWKS